MRQHYGSRKRVLIAVSILACTFVTACSLGPSTGTEVNDTSTRSPTPHAGEPIRIEYGVNPDNYGMLHLPAGQGPHPVVVMVHGGGWLEDHDLDYFEPLSRSLAEDGVAVWSIEYRRVGGEGGWPTTLADADDATEALSTVVEQAVPESWTSSVST